MVRSILDNKKNEDMVDTTLRGATRHRMFLRRRRRRIDSLKRMRQHAAVELNQDVSVIQEGDEGEADETLAKMFQTEDVPAIEKAILALSQVTFEMAARAGRMEHLIADINSKLDLTHHEFIASREECVGG